MIYCLHYHVNFVFVLLYLYLYLDIFVLASWYLCICILIFLYLHLDIFVFVFWYLCISGWHEARLRFEFTAWRHLIWSQSVVKGATHLMLCTSVAYNVNLWKKIHQKHWKTMSSGIPGSEISKIAWWGTVLVHPVMRPMFALAYFIFFLFVYLYQDIFVFISWYPCICILISS